MLKRTHLLTALFFFGTLLSAYPSRSDPSGTEGSRHYNRHRAWPEIHRATSSNTTGYSGVFGEDSARHP